MLIIQFIVRKICCMLFTIQKVGLNETDLSDSYFIFDILLPSEALLTFYLPSPCRKVLVSDWISGIGVSLCRQFTTCWAPVHRIVPPTQRRSARKTSLRKWTRTMTASWRRMSSWRDACRTRSCRKCWRHRCRLKLDKLDPMNPERRHTHTLWRIVTNLQKLMHNILLLSSYT